MIWSKPEDEDYRGACIYFFISPSGKGYVGQTKDLRNRMYGHQSDHLRRKKNGKWKFDTVWARARRKYGIKKMKVCILQKILTNENLNEALNRAEKKWILFYRTNEKAFGYNSDTGGNNAVRRAEWNLKIAKAHKGRKHTGQALANMRAANIKSAVTKRGQKRTGKALTNLRAANKKKGKSASFRANVSAAAFICQNKPETVALKRKCSLCKACVVTDTNGNEREYYSTSEAARQLGEQFSRRQVSRCCQREISYKGLTFKYKN